MFVQYKGSHDEVQLGNHLIQRDGESVEVDDDIGKELVARGDFINPDAKVSTRRPKAQED